jgi:hypothetical protein
VSRNDPRPCQILPQRYRNGGDLARPRFSAHLSLMPPFPPPQVIQLMALGDAHRSSASTNMNEHSSRSHLILSVYITSRNVLTGAVSRGKLHLGRCRSHK